MKEDCYRVSVTDFLQSSAVNKDSFVLVYLEGAQSGPVLVLKVQQLLTIGINNEHQKPEL